MPLRCSRSFKVSLERLHVTSCVWLATYLLSCTFSEIRRIIGPIFVVNRASASLNAFIPAEPLKSRIVKSGLYHMVQRVFWYLHSWTYVWTQLMSVTDRRTHWHSDSKYRASLRYAANKWMNWEPCRIVDSLLALSFSRQCHWLP